MTIYAPVEFAEFYESFDDCEGTGGNDGKFSENNNKTLPTYTNWTFTNPAAADRCVKVGSSKGGSVKTPALKLDAADTYVLTFKATQWATDGETLTLSSDDAIFDGEKATTVNMPSAKWGAFYVELTNGSATTQITMTPAKRMFLDEVRVMTKAAYEALAPSATVLSYGWATYIPDYNVTFAEGDAFVVTEASVSEGLTVEAVTSVPAKTPVLLKGAGEKTITVSREASVVAPETNLLTISNGTVDADKYPYVLAKDGEGACFKQWTGEASVLKDRAVLLLDKAVAEARSVFALGSESTGIAEIENGKLKIENSVYDLQGRRVGQSSIFNSQSSILKKGLYIVNGKKVMVK